MVIQDKPKVGIGDPVIIRKKVMRKPVPGAAPVVDEEWWAATVVGVRPDYISVAYADGSREAVINGEWAYG